MSSSAVPVNAYTCIYDYMCKYRFNNYIGLRYHFNQYYLPFVPLFLLHSGEFYGNFMSFYFFSTTGCSLRKGSLRNEMPKINYNLLR